MKHSWLAYGAVAAVSTLAGVAIAGPPNMVGSDTTIVVPRTTAAPDTTVPSPIPDADPERTTTTSLAETTTLPPTTTTTTTPATTTTVTPTSEPRPEVDRAAVVVVAVNGAGLAGVATRVSEELRAVGFVQARPDDGIAVVDATIVYHAVGFGAEAVDVAGVLGLGPGDVRPIAEAPSFDVPSDLQVAVYIGRDVA